MGQFLLTGCLGALFFLLSPLPFLGRLLLKVGGGRQWEGRLNHGYGLTDHLGNLRPFSRVSKFNFSYSIFLHSELTGRQWITVKTVTARSFCWQKSFFGAIKILAAFEKHTGGPSPSPSDHSAKSQETNNFIQPPPMASWSWNPLCSSEI